jgi:predicted dehydrogenase
MTVSAAEAEELQALALRQGRVLMVGHLLLYQSAIQWIKEYVASGELGDLHSIHQRRIQLGRVRSTENVLWSLGVHDLAVLLYLVGEKPVEIRSTGQRILQSHVEDDVYVHLAFPRGVHAHLHVSWLWPKQERQTIVVGSRGMLEYRELEQTVILHRKTALESLTFRDDGSEVVFQGDHQPLQAEAKHFLHCLETRRTPRSDGRNGVEVIRILEQATQMMKEGYGR